MKVCVFGAGAIGGHVAARLAKGGADVSVVARGANLAAISERGLTVHAPDGTMHCRPRASADPAALGPQDAVIVTTKAPALPSVAATIAPLLGPETPARAGTLVQTTTASCGPSSAGSAAALGRHSIVRSGRRTVRPRSRMAASWAPRATTETSAPPSTGASTGAST